MDLSAQQAHKLHALKKEAIIYYQENRAPEKMEESLNKMFYEKPDCTFGYLSTFFQNLAKKPVISGVKAQIGYDSRGVETLQVSVDCTFCNKKSNYAKTILPIENRCFENEKQEDKDKDEEERNVHITEAVNIIQSGFLKDIELDNLDPQNQSLIDSYLLEKFEKAELALKESLEAELEEKQNLEEAPAQTKPEQKGPGSAAKKKPGGKKEIIIIPDEPKEGLFLGCLALGTLSAACAVAGAKAAQKPLYQHIGELTQRKETEWKLPLPIVTILSGGKSSPGKSNCIKEYMLVPKPQVPYKRVISDLTGVCQHIIKTAAVKGGVTVKFLNELGCPNLVIDKPEVGLDLIQDALTKLEIKEDYNMVLNICAQDLFDYDKGKYELIQGGMKTGEELTDFLDDLLNKQPSIIALIDPVRKVEKEAWMRLSEKVSDRCLIVGDSALPRPGVLLQQDLQPDFQTSGWCARLQQRNTVSEILQCAEKMSEAGNQIIVSTGPSDTTDSLMVDLAVGMNCRFIKIGSPLRSEKLLKLQRLQEIGEELEGMNLLTSWEELSFTSLRLPRMGTNESEKSHTSFETKDTNNSRSKLKK